MKYKRKSRRRSFLLHRYLRNFGGVFEHPKLLPPRYATGRNNSLALDGSELLLNAAVSAELVLPTRDVALPCLSDETTAQKMFNAVSNCLDQLPLMQEFQPSNFPSGLYSILARNLQHNTLVSEWMSEGKTVFQSCWVILKYFTPDLIRPKYEGYPENKFRLQILPLQRCGHDGAQACRVFGFFVKARTQFADIWTVFTHRAVCL